MAKLAILGHATRGKEVIEILEMLGGKDCGNLIGTEPLWGYYINSKGEIDFNHSSNFDDAMSFTLEQFLKKFPYKIGDKVYNIIANKNQTITSLSWDSLENEVVYKTDNHDSYLYVDYLQPYKETPMYLNEKANKQFEEIKKILEPVKKIMEERDKAKAPDLKGEDYSFRRFGYNIPNGYEFECVRDNEIILKPIKLFPKTYEECCKVLMGKTDFHDFELVLTKFSITRYEENSISPEPPYITLINNFYKLLICRDAYWKIAGEQMGLGKLWEPDWDIDSKSKYVILCRNNNITKDALVCRNCIFAFPTEEMRDAFYKNFKELIELCKELL